MFIEKTKFANSDYIVTNASLPRFSYSVSLCSFRVLNGMWITFYIMRSVGFQQYKALHAGFVTKTKAGLARYMKQLPYTRTQAPKIICYTCRSWVVWCCYIHVQSEITSLLRGHSRQSSLEIFFKIKIIAGLERSHGLSIGFLWKTKQEISRHSSILTDQSLPGDKPGRW